MGTNQNKKSLIDFYYVPLKVPLTCPSQRRVWRKPEDSCWEKCSVFSSVGFRGDGHLRFRPPLEGDSELEIDLTISTEDDEGTLVMLTASNHSYFVTYSKDYIVV